MDSAEMDESTHHPRRPPAALLVRPTKATSRQYVRRSSYCIDPTPDYDMTVGGDEDTEDSSMDQGKPKQLFVRRGSYGMEPVENTMMGRSKAHIHETEAPELDPSISIKIHSSKRVPSLNLPPYVYEPLRGQSMIRLVQILSFDPATLGLRCRIELFDLAECPEFAALSYTWGSAVYSSSSALGCEIECQGTKCLISENLFDAFSIFAQSPDDGPAYIWADALSIDQNNKAEKAEQVRLMGKIYSRAFKVIVWLGPDAQAVPNFTRIRRQLEDILAELQRSNSESMFNPIDEASVGKIGIDWNEWLETWKGYFTFFQRHRYFRRSWVIQEIALGSVIEFACGSLQFGPEDIDMVGQIIRDTGWRHDLAAATGAKFNVGGLGDEADRMLDYRRSFNAGGPEDASFMSFAQYIDGAKTSEQRWYSYLQYMVQELRRFQASDQRDKIYAILGLAEMVLPAGSTQPLMPDYSNKTTPSGLYRTFTELLLQHLPLMSVLSYKELSLADTTPQNMVLPSWVPNYSMRLGMNPLIHLKNGTLFNACKHANQSPSSMRFSEWGEPPDFFPEGACFDYVREFSPPIDECYNTKTAAVNDHISPPVDVLLSVLAELPDVHAATGQRRLECFWRTLMADTTERSPVTHPAPAHYVNGFLPWLERRYLEFFLERVVQSNTSPRKREIQRSCSMLNLLSPDKNAESDFKTRVTPEAISEDVVACSKLFHKKLSKDVKHSRGFMQEAISKFFHQKPTPRELRHNRSLMREVISKISEESGPLLYAYDRAVREVSTGRVLFVTRNGNIGLGPQSMLAGDEVWLLMDAKVPFVLRKYRGAHQIVGEVYLHGFMQGEMMDAPGFKEKIRPVQIV